MLRTEYNRVLELMQELGELFGAKMTERRAELYLWLLKDYPLDVVERSVKKAMEVDQYFPKPARLKELIISDEQYRQEWNQREPYCKPFEGRDEWPEPGHPKERISLKQYEQETGQKLDLGKVFKRMPEPEEVEP